LYFLAVEFALAKLRNHFPFPAIVFSFMAGQGSSLNGFEDHEHNAGDVTANEDHAHIGFFVLTDPDAKTAWT
jgi:hypothetical protein